MLDLEVGHDPIRGVVSRPGVDSQPFYGWMELAQALEVARSPVVEQQRAPATDMRLLPT